MKSPRVCVAALLAAPCLVAGCSKSTPTTPASSASATSGAAAPGAATQPFDESAAVRNVRVLLDGGKLDEADAALAAALEQFPNAFAIHDLQHNASFALDKAGYVDRAFDLMNSCTTYYFESADANPKIEIRFEVTLERLAHLAFKLGGPSRALSVLDEFAARAEKYPATELPAIVAARRPYYLTAAGSIDEARAQLDLQLASARKNLDESPDDYARFERVAKAMQNRIDVERSLEELGAAHEAATTEWLDFLADYAKSHSDPRVQRRYRDAHFSRAQWLAYNTPDEAEAMLAQILAAIQASGDADAISPDSFEEKEKDIQSIRTTIDEARTRFRQYGQPAALPENADRWISADQPPTADSLRGQVVLLDFFAVWCQPCADMFPHLREWQEKYEDRGLQIIGVTEYYRGPEYYSADWNKGQFVDVENLSPDQERDALAQFAAHHKLAYPIAMVPDDKLQQAYLVGGIPHAILIDRAGRIRLARVGSGKQVSEDLERTIEECLAEPAP